MNIQIQNIHNKIQTKNELNNHLINDVSSLVYDYLDGAKIDKDDYYVERFTKNVNVKMNRDLKRMKEENNLEHIQDYKTSIHIRVDDDEGEDNDEMSSDTIELGVFLYIKYSPSRVKKQWIYLYNIDRFTGQIDEEYIFCDTYKHKRNTGLLTDKRYAYDKNSWCVMLDYLLKENYNVAYDIEEKRRRKRKRRKRRKEIENASEELAKALIEEDKIREEIKKLEN